jgi:hypothetical protein
MYYIDSQNARVLPKILEQAVETAATRAKSAYAD